MIFTVSLLINALTILIVIILGLTLRKKFL